MGKAIGESSSIYGAGGSPDAAQRSAFAAAQFSAVAELRQAPCPSCCQFPPGVTETFSAYGDSVAQKEKRGIKYATIVGAALLALGVGPALYDLRHSTMLLVTVLAGTAALSSFVFGIVSAPPPRPGLFNTARIHFWWGRPDGTPGWVPPPPVPLPALPAPTKRYVFSLLASVAAAVVALVAFIVWWETFTPVYVFEPGSASIRIDGADVSSEATMRGFEDGDIAKVTLRSDRDHRLELGDLSYTLARGASAWIVAPNAEAQRVCFVSTEMVYGSRTEKPGFERLATRDGLVVLERRYDDVFQASPPTMSVKQGHSESRWALRAVRCDDLEAKP